MNNELWDLLVVIGTKYHLDTVNLLANKITALANIHDFDKITISLQKWIEEADLKKLRSLCQMDESELSPVECATAMKAAALTARKIRNDENIEMVWTGPSTPFISTRQTEQALLEVIYASKKRLFIVSYVVYKIDAIMKALEEAMRREVKIDILVESSKEHGGKVSIDAMKLFKQKLPLANMYIWDDKLAEENGFTGSVHAKCAVADNDFAFITSANLTQAALQHNMELGILIRGGDIPARLHRHLSALVDTETIQQVD